MAVLGASVTVVMGVVAVTVPSAAATHSRPLAAKSSRAPATAPTGPFSVNISSREDARQFYDQVYQAANGVADGWTGSIAGCSPGSVSPGFLAAVLSRVNYFRTMAGEPGVTFNGTDAGTSADPNNAEAQAAALMESANNFLQHNPPPAPATACGTTQAIAGSSHSNLWEGSIGPSTVDGWVADTVAAGQTSCPSTSPNCMAQGHRRNMLNPSINVMGYGAVPATPGFQASAAQLVLTTPLPARPPVRSGFVAWPPAGFVPYQLVYPRWSFSLPNGDFSHATVSMSLGGTAVPVTIRCFDPTTDTADCGQFGEPYVSWTLNSQPDGSTYPQPAADQPYTVNVGNVLVNGTAQNFSYTVTVFDPAVSDPAHTLSSAPSGPAQPPQNSNPAYSVTGLADPQVTGYQWRTTPLSPENLVNDPAQNGMANWTANVSPAYPVLSTAEPTGAQAFRLSSQGLFTPLTAPAQQTLTLNQTLLAGASSQLSFGSLFYDLGFSATPSETASVDVSTDGGTTWTSVFSQSPPGTQEDTAFSPQTVPLSQFAGEQIQVRFSLTHTNGEWGNCCGEPNGWYIDNVGLSGVQAVGTPTLSAVGATPSFTFANSQQGTVALDVRPQFTNPTFGSSFLSWSPSTIVTTVGNTGLVSLTSSANPSAGSQQVTYTATVSPTDGGGTVSFTDNGSPISGCQSETLTGGQATCAQTYTFGGSHSIVAAYSGDTSFNGSASPALTQVVNARQATTISLTSSASTVSTGQQVTFTATVTPTDGGGTVNFYALEDTTAGCTAVPLNAAGQATCVTSFSVPRVQSQMQAFYSGDANFVNNSPSPPLQTTVIDPTSTSVTSSANPANPGDQVTYTATVTGSQFFLGYGSVSFSDDGTPIAACQSVPLTDNGGTTPHQATCAQTYPNGGAHSIQAFYSGYSATNDFAPSASAALGQSVGTLAATSTTLTSSANPANTGQAVTYTATVASSDNGGTVSFTDAGFPITGCQSEALDGNGSATCTQTYTNSSAHPIVAVYSGDVGFAGSSSATVTQTVTIPTATAAKAAITNVANGATTVGFTAPATARRHRHARNAGSASSVTGFNVYEGTAPGKESAKPVNPSRLLATATGYRVSGLTNGTKYYFVVRALNPGGLGARSAEVSATPATAPAAPGTLAAHGGNRSAGLTWTAPASTGGGAITGYNVYEGMASGGESATPVNPAPLGAKATNYTVKNLINGVKYYFTVRAANAVANGAVSKEASATPASVPYAPGKLLAYPGKGTATLTWAAPQQDGGSPITGYNVYKGTASGGESATPVNAAPLAAAATGYTVTGLANGTKYYFTVKAINAVGLSVPSREGLATPTTAATAPTAPKTLAASPGAASVALTWVKPASTGGDAITGYNVYEATLPGGESATPVNAKPLAATATSYTVTGLTNATGYYFTVRAINAVGAGVPSNEASATPEASATFPAAPGGLKATAGTGKATLTWTAPVWNGGTAITGYNVYKGTALGGESTTPVNTTPLAPAARSYTVTGLTHGTRYYFTVKAINAIGPSAPSNEASATP
jgi:hypothetical protein